MRRPRLPDDGQGITGKDDPDHGAMFVLNHNVTAARVCPRQFRKRAGVRIIGTSLDDYNVLAGAKQNLQPGASDLDGHDVTAMQPLANGHIRASK
jgi:hypothetical protein